MTHNRLKHIFLEILKKIQLSKLEGKHRNILLTNKKYDCICKELEIHLKDSDLEKLRKIQKSRNNEQNYREISTQWLDGTLTNVKKRQQLSYLFIPIFIYGSSVLTDQK
jgi:hypothetical protein